MITLINKEKEKKNEIKNKYEFDLFLLMKIILRNVVAAAAVNIIIITGGKIFRLQ